MNKPLIKIGKEKGIPVNLKDLLTSMIPLSRNPKEPKRSSSQKKERGKAVQDELKRISTVHMNLNPTDMTFDPRTSAPLVQFQNPTHYI